MPINKLTIPASVVAALNAARNPSGSIRPDWQYVHYFAATKRFIATNGHLMFVCTLTDDAAECMPKQDVHFEDWPKPHGKTYIAELEFGEYSYNLKELSSKGKVLAFTGRPIDEELKSPNYERAIPQYENYKPSSDPICINPNYLALVGKCFGDDVRVKFHVPPSHHKPFVIEGLKSYAGIESRLLILMGMKDD